MEEVNTINIQDAPNNTTNEIQILASIIINDKVIRQIVDSVTSKMFYNKYHSKIYTAMLYLYHNNRGINYKTIISRLQYKYTDDSELVDYVLQLTSVYMENTTLDDMIELLKDDFQKRELYDWALKRVTQSMSGIASANLVKEVEDKIEGMGISSNIENTNIHSYINEWIENLESKEQATVFKTGFNHLDSIVKIKKGKLIIVSARPGGAKSAFASKCVASFCKQDFTPLFVSLEMGRDEYLNRTVSELSGVSHNKFEEKDKLTNSDWTKIMVAKEKINKWQFEFNDNGSMKIEQLLGLCRHLKKKNKLDVLIVDYLQLLSSNEFRNQRQNQVSLISRGLKQIALELEIPVIALSQLSRASISHDGTIREPQLSDLRDSGSLEQDSDVVLMLHSSDVDNKFEYKKFITMFVRKNRQGKMGRTDFIFYGDTLKFKENKFNPDTRQWEIIEEDKFNTIEDLPF